MKVFIAGATGALGRRLVPLLVAEGHDVTGMTRTPEKKGLLRDLGARPVVADALDPDAVAGAVAAAEPEVIVHQLTALSGLARHTPVRAHVRAHQPAAHRGHGQPAGRRTRGGVEEVRRPELRRLDLRPHRRAGEERRRPARQRSPGPGPDHPRGHPPSGEGRGRRRLDRGDRSSLRRLLRPRHVARDASGGRAGGGRARAQDSRWWGEATACGLSSTSTTRPPPPRWPWSGDGPGSTTSWTMSRPRCANGCPCWPARSAPSRPGALPRWLARILAGEAATVMMTEIRGASNAKAKRELGWEPGYKSWRRGFAEGLG